MKVETIVRDLEEAARALGFRVRKERGSFRGGLCERNGEELLMLNKIHPPEIHLSVLATVLKNQDMDAVYLRPVVRQALEDAWDRQVEVEMQESDDDD